MDQLIIGKKASLNDFGASLAYRTIGKPKKKSIRETVPFSNKTHDFSKINGEQYWEDRTLEYVFEITADSPEELETLKSAFSGWVMNVFEEEIHDPFIPDFHFLATYEDMKVEDDEGLDKTTLTVTFKAYPYKIANNRKGIYRQESSIQEALPTTPQLLVNNSHHPVPLRIKVDCENAVNEGKYLLVEVGGTRHSIYLGVEYEMTLPCGTTEVELYSRAGVTDGPTTASFTFKEEVF